MSEDTFIQATFLLTVKQDRYAARQEAKRRRAPKSNKSGRGRHLREQAALECEEG